MEISSALLALSAGNSPVTGEFPAQRPLTQSFDIFFDLHLNKRLSKQSWGWWFETSSRSLWRLSNGRWFSRLTQSRMEIIGKIASQKLLSVLQHDLIAMNKTLRLTVHINPSCGEKNDSNKLFLCMCTISSYRFLNMSVVSQTTLINQFRKPIFLSPKARFLSSTVSSVM